ncbi:MAG: GDSL-type esterase/lipase family protein [Bacillota bacterium]|nr:GDSL-type esterase/lipase family protein [Bacillota bacterium]
MKKKTRNRLILAAPLVALTIVGGTFFFSGESISTSKGVSYIKKQESKSTKSLQNTLTEIRKKEQDKLLEEGKISVFDLLHDYVIYGDSRVCGFSENGFLPASRIFAKAGDGIKSIPKWEKQLSALSPSHIYFLYGINELDEIVLDKGADYKEEYTKAVRKVMRTLPESHIYICSIIPVSQNVSDSNAKKSYEDVPGYNRILKSICEENGWKFIDMGDAPLNDSYYQDDGIHLRMEFYEQWAQALVEATED